MEIPILPQLSTPGFFLLFLVAPTDPQFHSVEGGTGAFTAAISRRFDLLQLVIPASIPLQCALFPCSFGFAPPPLGHFRSGARWLAPPHGRARPTGSSYDVTHAD